MNYTNIDRIGRRLFRYPIYNFLKLFSTTNMPEASDEPIDVIIPIIAKDLLVLPLCIEGIKKNVLNKINAIYLVGPSDDRIISFAKKNDLIYVEEDTVLGFGVKDIKYITNKGENRSGWLFQQLIKLSGNIGQCQNFVTIDSDHILINPHVFLTKDDTFIFYQSEEFHWTYIKVIYQLIGVFAITPLSYVSHKMIFNKEILVQLKNIIEQRSGKKWTDTIISSLNRDDSSPFSEFELYANFVSSKKKKNKLWLQKTLYRATSIKLAELQNRYNDKLSVTYPEYLQIK